MARDYGKSPYEMMNVGPYEMAINIGVTVIADRYDQKEMKKQKGTGTTQKLVPATNHGE